MANFMKHNADEIDLVRCWIAIRSQIPIGRAVKRGNDVRTVGVNVISHQLIGQSYRVKTTIQWKRPTRQRVVRECSCGTQSISRQIFPVGFNHDGNARRQQIRPNVHSILEGRLCIRRKPVVVHHERGGVKPGLRRRDHRTRHMGRTTGWPLFDVNL